MKILSGHVSPETAYVVEDYPYGFRLRCRIRYWLEYKPRLGIRFVSQTTNPKRGDIWNKPKASTYAIAGCMFLDENGHVQWSCCHAYMDRAELEKWTATYFSGVPAPAMEVLHNLLSKLAALEAAKVGGGQ